MHEVVQVTGYLSNGLFLVLGLVAVHHWRLRKDEAAAWVAATFLLLGSIAIVGVLLPQDVDGGPLLVLQKVLIVALGLFPYLLYRFSAVFEPRRPGIHRLATAATGVVAVAALALPRVPGPGEGRPLWFRVFVVAILLQWTGLTALVAYRLWRGGRGQPTVTRRRMRLLGVASGLMAFALLLAAAAPQGEEGVVDLAVDLVAITSAVLFFGGFAPPAFLRLAWRRPEEQALQAAQLQLMAVTTPDEVMGLVLPHVTGALGGQGAALVDGAGGVVVSHGTVPDLLGPDAGVPAVRLDLDRGALLIWTSPHTPFFGREELGLLRTFGVVADLALARCELLERQRQSAASLERANRQLEAEIRDRTLAAERLAQSEQRLEEAQQIAHIGSWQWEIEPDEVIWSDELYRIYGLDPTGFTPSFESVTQRAAAEDADVGLAAVRQAQADHRPFSFDQRVVRPDGTIRVVHVQGKVVVDGTGRARRMVGAAQDITDRKAAEDALAKAFRREREARQAFERINGELESFVYSVSHDLKSPMISLLGYLDYLKLDFGSALPAEAQHYLDRMSASGVYLQALIQDLLELSRVGRSSTEREPVDLAAVLGEVVDEVTSAHPAVLVEAGPLPVLRMNPLRARQLLTNLVGNAVEHGGRPDVHVLVTSQRQSDGSVAVSVSDDGPGIPEAYREKVFGVFERLLARDGPGGGTGIGLSICRKIVESLGGSIRVADSEAGASFRACFPAEVVQQPVSTVPRVRAGSS